MGDGAIETIEQEARRQCNEASRHTAVRRAQEIIYEIAGHQREIESLKKKLSELTAETY